MSSSQSRCNLGAAGEAGAVVEADATEEQQPKQTQWGAVDGNRGVAAEADTSGKQQLKRTQTGSSASALLSML